MKLKGRVIPLIISIVFFAVGVAVIYLSATAFAEGARYAKTTATVISAKVWYSDDGKLTAASTFEYFVNGERFVKKTAAQDANSAKFEGETFTVRYDPDDPATIRTDSFTPVIMLAFGLIFTCVGGGLAVALLTGKLN